MSDRSKVYGKKGPTLIQRTVKLKIEESDCQVLVIMHILGMYLLSYLNILENKYK